MEITPDFQAAINATNTRLYHDNGDHVLTDFDDVELARSFYMSEGHYCTPVQREADGWGFDVYDLGQLPDNNVPIWSDAIDYWAAYARSHRPLGFIEPQDQYPAIDGDATAIAFQGSLPRTSVVGETTLWEKVSAS